MLRNQPKLKKYLIVLLGLGIYKIGIELIYLNVVSPLYEYSGFLTQKDLTSFFLSIIYLVLYTLYRPKNEKYISTSLFNMIVLFILIPANSYYWMSSQSHLYTLVLNFSFYIISSILKIKRIYIIDRFKHASLLLKLMFFLYIIVTIYVIISGGGFDARALDFSSIYSLREEADVSTINGYLMNWCAKVLSPFFFAYFIYRRRYIFGFIVLLLQLLLYLTFGFKAFIFSIGFMLACFILNTRGNFDVKFIYFYLSIQVISAVHYLITKSISLVNSVAYRMLYIPAQVQYQYFEFFKINPKVNFADGLIGLLLSIESPYSLPMPNVISMAYYNKIFSQNSGVFGDAFGNGGFWGMVIIAIILGILLYVIDIVSKNIPKIYVIAAFSYLIFVLNDTSLLTALFTGGIGLLIVLIYFFNSELESEITKMD